MKIIPGLEEVARYRETGEYKVVPVCCELLADTCTPIQAVRKLKNVSSHCFLLESAEPQEKWGRYTFLGYDPKAQAFATEALKICSLEFFLYGFCLVTAGFFTGLDQGTISAIIAFCQSLVAPIVFIYLLPVLFGVENIWFAAPAAMVVGAILGTTFLTRKWSKLEEIVDMDDESE